MHAQSGLRSSSSIASDGVSGKGSMNTVQVHGLY